MMSVRLCVCFMRTTIPPPSAIPKTRNSGSGTGNVGVKLSDILQTVTIYIKVEFIKKKYLELTGVSADFMKVNLRLIFKTKEI